MNGSRTRLYGHELKNCIFLSKRRSWAIIYTTNAEGDEL